MTSEQDTGECVTAAVEDAQLIPAWKPQGGGASWRTPAARRSARLGADGSCP
jgi:hypothetical protein